MSKMDEVTVSIFDDERFHIDEIGTVFDKNLSKEIRDYFERSKNTKKKELNEKMV